MHVALPAALLLGFLSSARAAIVYPRLALPGCMHDTGRPYLDAAGDLDTAVVAAAARFDLIILDVSPVSEYHPEVLAALRARNPGITCLGYVLAENIWAAQSPDSLVHYPTRYRRTVRDLDGFLYNTAGAYYDPCCVNIAKRDSTGRFVVAEAIVQLFYDVAVRPGIWDGLFVDVYCDDLDWTQTATQRIDVVRAGYPDYDSFAAAWDAASDTMAARLRALCGPDFLLVGNCNPGDKYGWFNGWTRESFPFQMGGTWYTNMFRTTGGYFVDEQAFRSPVHNVIFTPFPEVSPYTADHARRVRFALGSAALGTGFAIFGPPENSIVQDPVRELWWFDEYAVDLETGRSSASRARTGWLGPAVGSYYEMIWAGGGADAVPNSDFESSVTDGWTFWCHASASATLTRDSTTAAIGRSSAHVRVEAGGSETWHVTFAGSGDLVMAAGQNYAATFWARASKPRTIGVAAAVSGTNYATGVVSLGTAWQQYQVVLQPKVSCTAKLFFWLGADDGDVWLDGAHLQAGVSGIYRRDFANGTILVNPSDQVLTVPLGSAYRKILGTVDPATNDGAPVTEVTVPPSDAIFLIRTDRIPPGTPRDLRITR